MTHTPVAHEMAKASLAVLLPVAASFGSGAASADQAPLADCVRTSACWFPLELVKMAEAAHGPADGHETCSVITNWLPAASLGCGAVCALQLPLASVAKKATGWAI